MGVVCGVEQLEAKGDHLKAAHSRAMGKLTKQVEKLQSQLKEKQAENDRLERRRREMEESVALRRSILESRALGKTGAGAADADRLKVCVFRNGCGLGVGLLHVCAAPLVKADVGVALPAGVVCACLGPSFRASLPRVVVRR